ncbi:MAG TPA: hypothetical protein PKO06_02010 [Candidatus Ozemobacteraceae bacterium]|nr:hypothetical protein [Candidatus Ozemobacteraceae bacterium]
MRSLFLTLVYLGFTVPVLLRVGDSEQILILTAIMATLGASMAILARAIFQLRSDPDDWAFLTSCRQRPSNTLSDHDRRKCDYISNHAFCSLYFSGITVCFIFWRILCEESNPLDVFPSSELAPLVPALIPVLLFLLLEEWLSYTLTASDADAADPLAFWRLAVQVLVMAYAALGPLQNETVSDDARMLLIICGAGIPPLIFTISFLYRLMWREQASGEA